MVFEDLRKKMLIIRNRCRFTKKRDGLLVVFFWGGGYGIFKLGVYGSVVGSGVVILWCFGR